MSQGRCPGCGETGPAAEVLVHTYGCSKFAKLYREHREQALSPVAEYRRWREQEKDAEQQARVAAKVESGAAGRAVMADRFRTPKDILED